MTDLTDEQIKWIKAHYNDDVSKLRLRNHKTGDSDIDFAILQIECRHRAQRKLSATLRNPRFIFPTSLSAEQCTSDALAEFHTSLIVPGETVLDMTCGLGIDSFHIAGVAKSVTSVEINPDIARAATINARNQYIGNITVINDDCVNFINNDSGRYDTVFIDPARRGSGGKRLYALSDCSPDITSILPVIRAKSNRLIIKASPMLDISKTLAEIPDVTDVYSIGTKHECKELVIVIGFNANTPDITLHAVTLHDDSCDMLSYSIEQEQNAIPRYETPQCGHYLYEPFPAVMKSAPFRLLSEKYGVGKLHPNTHVYTSSALVKTFPGTIYAIDDIIPFSSREIKAVAASYPQINVATRNFILSADELRKRLKAKDGGEKKLIGVTAGDARRLLLILTPINV